MARKRNRQLSKWDVEDLIQTAFLELFLGDWSRLKNYDPSRGMTLTSWVVLLTQHAVWDFFNELPDHPRPDNESDQEDEEQSPEDKLIDKESALLYLESLTDIERLVIKMKYFENLEIADIAHIIHRSKSRVYQILKQARKKLGTTIAD
ncbi:MAG: RNA polymerase sigma-70 factor, ECF subfamily [Candidatus Magnetoglobus multicellularis str. Araruama]|uniref:RNA polymerase sigma-70 factor, ECF subfamily n=1 Tax=Candidatus Magnetoglobus multicellularis str. Araruama TaxID=890399 RepID=A0A1V1P4N8_9BACT|nr:MAG: RNA polymerase sigma-70 factor, ECF subfamily [Candidatus Magnetoglobus multicellularis str. Araruama]